ncbi:MAG: membrane anchor subunit [Candidatus Tokpelaia sp. JSC085]|nr:MAG: membrane anchor subunit [Candidatus Tokpelaia sp. JSC085]
MKDFRTPLCKARGLGSARDGTEHFWMQRLTALANIPLFLFFITIVVTLIGKDYNYIRAIIGNPIIALIMALMVLSGIYHMKLGMQVIIEDYVHGKELRASMLALNIFFSFSMGLACIFALLKITLEG